MRTHGAKTKIDCWTCEVRVNNSEVFKQDFPTLSSIGQELGLSRNIVNEIVNNRRKQRSGKYDTQYIIKKKEDDVESLN